MNRYAKTCTRLNEKKKSLESRLRKTELHLKSIIDNSSDIIYRLDSNGKIEFISESIRNYGYAPEELIGKSLLDIVHKEDRKRALFRINERRTGGRRTSKFEVRMLKKLESSVSAELFTKGMDIQPVFLISAEGLYSTKHPRSDTFIGTQGIARDITDTKITRAELFQVMDHLKAVLDAVPGCVSWISADLTYLGVNRYLSEYLGQPPEFFIGKKVGFQKNDTAFEVFIREFMTGSKKTPSFRTGSISQWSTSNFPNGCAKILP